MNDQVLKKYFRMTELQRKVLQRKSSSTRWRLNKFSKEFTINVKIVCQYLVTLLLVYVFHIINAKTVILFTKMALIM
jgi:hypothetical protein